jgi:hypothetical protein
MIKAVSRPVPINNSKRIFIDTVRVPCRLIKPPADGLADQVIDCARR